MSWRERLANLVVHRRWSESPGEYDPAQVGKILVVRNDNIGDVICTTPALDALREAFPGAQIDAVVCTLAEDAISGHRALDNLHVYPKAKHKQHGAIASLWLLGRVLGRLKKERYDLVVAFRSNFSMSQAWIVYASGGRWRLGPRAEGKKADWGFFYNLPVDPPPPGIHEVERCFHLLGGVRVDSQAKSLYLKVPAQAKAVADKFRRENGLDGEIDPVVLNVTRWAYRPDRAWPPERYRDLAARLAALPGGVVITHAPADREWVREIMAGIEPRPPMFWSRSLKDFCAMAASGGAFITAEGGPMHLAAAVGAPVVVLWADTPQEVWRPWCARSALVGGRGPVADISVDQVMAALEEITSPAQAGRE